MSCPPPDPTLGTVLRVTRYFECNAEALGRDGFLALADFTVSDGILGGVLTISVALVGYRLLLGERPTLSDGAGWFIRVGMIFALLSGWAVFQTLFYDVVVVAPSQLADRILAESGASMQVTDQRAQLVYEDLRTGLASELIELTNASPQQRIEMSLMRARAEMPGAASEFFYLSVGLRAAAQFVGAFLLAVAPFPIVAIMFAPSFGLFIGWLRALLATTFAMLGLTIVKVLHLSAVESELMQIKRLMDGERFAEVDWDGINAFNATFSLIALATVVASIAMSVSLSAVLLPFVRSFGRRIAQVPAANQASALSTKESTPFIDTGRTPAPPQSRAAQVVDSLNRTLGRENMLLTMGTGKKFDGSEMLEAASASRTGQSAARRALGRRHRSTARREIP